MKKALTTILAILMILSISTVSFASVIYRDIEKKPSFEKYIGVWYGENSNNGTYTVTIGRTADDYFMAFITKFTGTDALCMSYYISYDNSSLSAYLTDTEVDVRYKLTLRDDKMSLYNVHGDSLEVQLDKLK